MAQNTYLFLIDYVKSLLEHPIVNGVQLGIFILLWQVIGTVVFLFLGDLLEPLRVKLKLDVNYFVLILACLTGVFLSVYFLSGTARENNVYDRAFRLIGIFGCVFLFFVPITLILGAGIIIPIFSFMMWIVNGIISLLPILAGLAVIMPILFFGGLFSIVGAIVGRL